MVRQTALPLLCGLLPCLGMAQQRSAGDAEKIAMDFLSGNPFMRKGTGLKLNQPSSSVSSSNALAIGKEAYYVFSATSPGGGFVIVSGDERMPAILAYSEENDFDTDSVPPNVRFWLDCYEEAFWALNDKKEPSPLSLKSVRAEGVAPLLGRNAWGQDNPYNRLCPSVRGERCVTGCVATAMAQVMSYHKYPDRGKGVVSYRTETNNIQIYNNLDAGQLRWNDMLDDYSGEYTSDQANAVAELMYACGSSVKMDYCTGSQGGSGAYQKDLVTAFVDNFGYDSAAAFMARSYCSIEDWHQFLVNELNEGRPVNYGGHSARDGGHSFVCDGYRTGSGDRYPDYHMNWGWNGRCDGYYQVADLHPSEDGQHATYGGFNSSQQITIGIKPEDGTDECTVYLCTPNLHVSSSTVKAGDKIQVYTASCSNFSYRTFNGTVHAALVSMEDGSETILGDYRMMPLAYLQEQNNLSLDITLPSDLAEGQYKIQLRSKQYGKHEYQQVISRQYPFLEISMTGDTGSVVTDEPMLGCSELEAVSGADSLLIAVNIYELQNLRNSPFIGDLKMILADKTGKQLCSFGDSIQPGELSTFEIQAAPLKIQGQLFGEWPDGDYRLYIGARLINTSKFVYVSFYDIVQPDIAFHDICLNAKIEDGRLFVGGKSFIISSPTSVIRIESGHGSEGEDTMASYDNNPGEIYHMNGMLIGPANEAKLNLRGGIYFIRRGDTVKKLYVGKRL